MSGRVDLRDAPADDDHERRWQVEEHSDRKTIEFRACKNGAQTDGQNSFLIRLSVFSSSFFASCCFDGYITTTSKRPEHKRVRSDGNDDHSRIRVQEWQARVVLANGARAKKHRHYKAERGKSIYYIEWVKVRERNQKLTRCNQRWTRKARLIVLFGRSSAAVVAFRLAVIYK